MKWEHCAGGYKAFVSLGSTCQTAYQLNRLGLRKLAGPLDWFVSRSVPGLTQLLSRRFEDFMALRNLQIVGSTAEALTVKDSLYDVVSFHDFPPIPSPSVLWEAYPDFKAKVDRRVQRFQDMVRLKPVLFVRTEATREEAYRLHGALGALSGWGHRLLIVNTHTDGYPGLLQEEWGMDGICSVSLPAGPDWKGSDSAWMDLMRGFTVTA